MLWVHDQIFLLFHRGVRLCTSGSDVYRRQILMYTGGSRAEKVKESQAGLIIDVYIN